MAESESQVELGAVAFTRYPLHESGSWDAAEAEKRLRAWASSDGSGDWEKVDRAKYSKGFAYVRDGGEHPDQFLLPHHDVEDGHLVTVKAGVVAACNALSGSRGGVNIPSADLPAVKHHLAEERHLFGEKAPWEQKSHAEKRLHASMNRPQGELALLSDPETALGSTIPMPRIGAPPPTRMRLFQWGVNLTTKGPLRLTPEGATKIMDDFRSRGVAKCFDFCHSTFDPEVAPADRKAAGQFLLAVESDGLWAVDIQWTPSAGKAISDGEWPFLSPAVVHDKKSGEIVQVKNCALVTDPATFDATPTILSGSTVGAAPIPKSPKPLKRKHSMSEKRKTVLDAYAACESAMSRCQALADTDGPEADLGNEVVEHLAPAVDKMRAHVQSSGYMPEHMAGKKMEGAKEKLFGALSAQFGESDPAKLGKLVSLRMLSDAPAEAEGVTLSSEDAAAASKLLLDLGANRYPASKRAALEKQGLDTIVSYLSSAKELTPSSAPRERAPVAPTRANLEEATKKPTSLAELSADQRLRVEQKLALSRRFMGDAFREEVELQHAMASLSDYTPPEGEKIRPTFLQRGN